MSLLNVAPPEPDYSGYSDEELLNEVYKAIIINENIPLRLEQLLPINKQRHVATRLHALLQKKHIIYHQENSNDHLYRLTPDGYEAEIRNFILRTLSKTDKGYVYNWQKFSRYRIA